MVREVVKGGGQVVRGWRTGGKGVRGGQVVRGWMTGW